jgi:hypothetical protein
VPQLLAWKWTDDQGVVWTVAMTSGTNGADADPYTVAGMLVKGRLWTRQTGRRRNANIPASFLVHDYHHYQPSREHLTALRAQNRKRQAEFRQKRSRRDNTVTNAVTTPLVTHAPSRSKTPTPKEEVLLRDRSEETDAATLANPNGAAPLIDPSTYTTYVDRVWDDYPDKTILRDELTDRGLTQDQADQLIANHQ